MLACRLMSGELMMISSRLLLSMLIWPIGKDDHGDVGWALGLDDPKTLYPSWLQKPGYLAKGCSVVDESCQLTNDEDVSLPIDKDVSISIGCG